MGSFIGCHLEFVGCELASQRSATSALPTPITGAAATPLPCSFVGGVAHAPRMGSFIGCHLEFVGCELASQRSAASALPTPITGAVATRYRIKRRCAVRRSEQVHVNLPAPGPHLSAPLASASPYLAEIVPSMIHHLSGKNAVGFNQRKRGSHRTSIFEGRQKSIDLAQMMARRLTHTNDRQFLAFCVW
jgi:hypothetical protein